MNKARIGVGILGAGQPNIATDQQLPGTLRASRVQLIALCDVNPGVKDYAAKHHLKAYSDYPAMLADPEIELVEISTPDQFHCEHALAALAAGKHVLLQKPPCVDRSEMEQLIDAAGKATGRIGILINQRYSLLSRSIKHYLERFLIGELREIIIRYRGRRFPIANPGSFYLTAESGGVWLHNSLHWLDEAFYYSEKLPQSVSVLTNRNDHGASCYLGEGPNYFSAVFPMAEKTFLFEYNTMLLADNLPGGMERTLIGTHGELRCPYGSNEIHYYKLGSNEKEILPLLECKIDGNVESFRIAIDEFAGLILNGNDTAGKFADSMALFDLLLQGLEK